MIRLIILTKTFGGTLCKKGDVTLTIPIFIGRQGNFEQPPTSNTFVLCPSQL